MSYSDIEREILNGTGVAATSTGVIMMLGFKRRARILGFGVICASAQSGGTTQPVFQIRRNGTAVDSITATSTLATTVGAVAEKSELLRGLNPAAPDGVMTAFEVGPGDRVDINVSTAEAATTAARWIPYILVDYAGSP